MHCKTEPLFPTYVHRFQDVLSKKDLTILFEKIDEGEPAMPPEVVQEVGYAQALYIDYPPLEEAIQEAVNEVMIERGIRSDLYEVEVTEMWANVLKKGTGHHQHNHSNVSFAGVLYLFNGQGTTFFDPRPQSQQWTYVVEETPVYPYAISVSAAINTMVIFDPWLMHSVQENTKDQDRVSVAFNVLLRGKHGTRYSLEEVMI